MNKDKEVKEVQKEEEKLEGFTEDRVKKAEEYFAKHYKYDEDLGWVVAVPLVEGAETGKLRSVKLPQKEETPVKVSDATSPRQKGKYKEAK